MKKRLLALTLILATMLAYNSVATGYVAGTASHTTLYTDTIRGKAGANVIIDDGLQVRGQVFTQGAWGTHTNGHTGYLGGANEGAKGTNANGNNGVLGSTNEGVKGTNSNGNFGSLGTNSDGVYGLSSNGNEGRLATASSGVSGKNSATSTEGYIAGANEGVRGIASSGNYGQLGTSLYGVYGYSNVNGNYGYLGASSYGVYGRGSSSGIYGINSNGNYGYIGGSALGVYGSGNSFGVRGECNGCSYGLYTSDKVYGGNGIEVGGAAQCTDSNTAACALNDIAEDIYSKDELESGDVVVIDSENNEHVKKSSKPYDTLAAGIISGNPAFHIKTSGTGVSLALAGRVTAKASAENGPIRRGNLLVTSSTPGHLMKCGIKDKCFGALVGKAMEPLEKGKGKIMVLVALG